MWGILVMKYAGSLGQFMNEYVRDCSYEIYAGSLGQFMNE